MTARCQMTSKSEVDIDPARSKIMRAVRRADTTPEMLVRKVLRDMGLRFQLHRQELPGTPDVVLPGFRAVIFVHGCFWHRHQNCPKATTPRTREKFWREKFLSNVARDRRAAAKLRRLGWRVLTVWECQVRDRRALERRFRRLFG